MHAINRIALVLGLLFVMAGVGSHRAAANTPFVINSTVDEPDALSGNGQCASQPSGVCTLRAAIMEANALPGPDSLILPAGIYTLTVAGAGENAGATGDLDISSDLTVTGATSATTIIDGNQLDRVFQITGTVTASLVNVTIRNGLGQSPAQGGGLLNWNSTLALINSRVMQNQAPNTGGVANIYGQITLLYSAVLSNVATNGSGAGLTNFNGTLVLTDTLVSGNESQGPAHISNIEGGGIHNYSGQVSLAGSVLSFNAAHFGAGLYSEGPGVITIQDSLIYSNTNQGLWINGATVTIVDSVIAANATVDEWGVIAQPAGLTNYYGQATLLRTQVLSNTSNYKDGGAVANLGGVMTITASVFRGNASLDPNGGGSALFNRNLDNYLGRVTIVATEFSDNTAVGNGTVKNEGTLVMNQSRITDNQARGGGAFYNSGLLTVTASTVSSNQVVHNGGGLYNNGQLTLNRAVVTGNSATEHGGGLYLGGNVTLNNVTISGNSAGHSGGGLYGAANATLSSVTVVNNTADSGNADLGNGGGIQAAPGAVIKLQNTLIADNYDLSLQKPNCGSDPADTVGFIQSLGYNLLSDNTGCPLTAGTGDQTGTGGSPLDPLIGGLANNGGGTLTHALLAGSPALDAGNPSGCTDRLDQPLTTDQRGYPRSVDGDADNTARCDIGAYEWWQITNWVNLPLLLR